MSYFLPKGDYVMMYVILCISIHMMLIVLFVCFPVTFSVNDNSISIEVFTGLNFKKWKEDFLFGMELADVHIALTKDKPADITATSIKAEKMDYAAWEKSNRICLLTMKKSIQEYLKSGLPADCTAKEMMAALEARNRISFNAEIGTLLQKLFNINMMVLLGLEIMSLGW